jgi:hypothetical protein
MHIDVYNRPKLLFDLYIVIHRLLDTTLFKYNFGIYDFVIYNIFE